MRVTVNQLLVTMRVQVWLAGRVGRTMRVLLMCVVRVQVFMLRRFVPMPQ